MAKRSTARVTIGSAHCVMFVQGIDMLCPLCKMLVRSGEHHECSIQGKNPAPGKSVS